MKNSGLIGICLFCSGVVSIVLMAYLGSMPYEMATVFGLNFMMVLIGLMLYGIFSIIIAFTIQPVSDIQKSESVNQEKKS